MEPTGWVQSWGARVAAALSLAAALCACVGPEVTAGDAGTPDSGTPDAGPATPITAAANKWTWVDFPDSACDDGTPTGIGVNPGTSSDVIVFMNGGGACWDAQTCLVNNTSAHGPFGGVQFNQIFGGGSPTGSVLDRAAPNNPFATWNLVFVPYCTGDVHGGDNVVTYTAGSTTKTFHHTGHRNFVAFLRRLAVTFGAPGQAVLTGSSAGGFGATLNYDTFRATWAGATGSLIDDSGPLLVGDAVAPALRAAWYQQWNLGALADPLCGQVCRGDLSQVWSVLASKHPTDRLSLLSSQQDQTIRAYLSLSAADFQAAITKLDTDRLEAAGTSGRTRVFYIPGSSHTMLGNMAPFSQNGVALTTFLQQQVSGAAWVSQKP